MTSDIDILRTANLLIRQHGDQDATLYAAMRADAMLDAAQPTNKEAPQPSTVGLLRSLAGSHQGRQPAA